MQIHTDGMCSSLLVRKSTYESQLTLKPSNQECVLSSKWSPRYCGPFTISRRLGEVTYESELPRNSKVFLVFHVHQLREALTRSENLVGHSVLVLPLDSQQLPHETEEILSSTETQTRHTLYQEYLFKWTDQPVENATWEKGSILRKLFPDLVLEEQGGS
ncbi:hypothetical protein O6H91_06G095700 [Diphasiastrum complanatum]|uniref:Uncharacterized protein n=1 Tax=Diphasiastrum complanatum TaxID=34168 RepID=A0ACC2DHB4_DIPCM|nr:hypothetical protein O6H91_06G095700 [Diphasiastrum complanatum]